MINLRQIIESVIKEMPLGKYQTFGDFNQSHSFQDPKDRQMVTSEKNIKKVYDFFKKVNVDIDLYFVNTPESANFFADDMSYGNLNKYGELPLKNFTYEEMFGITEEQFNFNKNAISIIFISNYGDKKITLTPWIIAHRISHVLDGDHDDYTTFILIEKSKIYEKFKQMILELVYEYKTMTANQYVLPKIDIVNKIFTFHSAKTGKLNSYTESLNELFAQYILKGHIEILPIPEYIESLGVKYQNRNVIKCNAMLQTFKQEFETSTNKILKEAVGKIYYI